MPYSSATGLPAFPDVIAIDPAHTSTIYVAGNEQVSRSTDGGATWTSVSTGLTGNHAQALALDPLDSNTIYVGFNTGGIFKSTNAGGNWNAINSGLAVSTVKDLVVDPTTSGTIYTCLFSSLVKSTDGGMNWNAGSTNIGGSTLGLTLDPADHNVLYAASNNGVYKTIDGGDALGSRNHGDGCGIHERRRRRPKKQQPGLLGHWRKRRVQK